MLWVVIFLFAAFSFATTCDSQHHSACQHVDDWDLHGTSLIQTQVQLDKASKVQPVAKNAALQIFPPAPGKYHLNKTHSYAEWAQDLLVAPFFQGKNDGFFVEAGAVTGEEGSNTLFYEQRGWDGLLIEPNPLAFATLATKGRKAFSYNGCLSTSNHIQKVTFEVALDGFLGTDSSGGGSSSPSSYTSTCAPLQTLLGKLNRTTVDLWSLDVEGAEPGILENTDFNNIEVGVMVIEWNQADKPEKQASYDRMQAAMDHAGFQYVGSSYYTGGWGQTTKDTMTPQDPWVQLDRVFVNPQYFQARGLTVPTELPENPLRPAPA